MTRPKTPELTVDIIIEMHDRPEKPIVLIERKYKPFGWAIPGGFVDVGETVSQAAIREAQEETCLEVQLDVLLGCYSNPARDPRGHTVGLVFVAHANGTPRADDDAAALDMFDPDNIDVELAFDHGDIIRDYRRYRESGVLPLPE
jgi:8-oxo-dGTP diphosphatase